MISRNTTTKAAEKGRTTHQNQTAHNPPTMHRGFRNIFLTPPGECEEIFHLLSGNSFRLEAIASRGQVSPDGFWYDQEDDEWVALLRGSAALEFDDGEIISLKAGDVLLIEAHDRHRVSRTSNEATWLALHFNRGSINESLRKVSK